MKLITWSENYSVGVREIDEQHQILIGMLNELFDAMMRGTANDVLDSILDKAIEYTTYHFGNEETYMDKFEFSGYAEHKAEHKEFIDQVLEFKNDFKGGRVTLSVRMMNFLRDWVSKHIQGTDKLYTKVFNENGII